MSLRPAKRGLGALSACCLIAGLAGCPDTDFPSLAGSNTRNCTAAELEAFKATSIDPQREDLWIAFIDVGHGDATWIRTPGTLDLDAKDILIDAGDVPLEIGGMQVRPDGAAAIRRFMSFADWPAGSPIDYLVISHPDSDHFGGAIGVLEDFSVRSYVDPGYPKEGSSWSRLQAAVAQERGLRDLRPASAKRMELGKWGRDVQVELLNANGDAPDENSASIVISLKYHGVTVLLTGDAQEALEETLIGRGVNLRATVLKAAHHGGQGTSGADFLERVFPGERAGRRRYAIVSAGAFTGLPDEKVLARLEEKVGRRGLYRTDRRDEGKSRLDAPGDDDVLLRIATDGDLSVCFFSDDR